MNQTILSGNLTADIEVREIGDQHLSKFTLACNEGDRVVFLPVEAWNQAHLAEHIGKGSKVLISGSLKQDSWETDAGEKRSRIVLIGYKVEFLDPAPEQAGHRSGASSGRQQTNRRSAPPQNRNRKRSVA
ncbi:MAG: single-stranded DNA-binding protein [Coraliomargarita sp.]|nr:single-stranded DNA-binding protein [Coraliomargarita sp.]